MPTTWTLIGSDDFTETDSTNLEDHIPSGTNALASGWSHLTWQFSSSASIEQNPSNATEAPLDWTVTQPYYVGSQELNPYVIGPTAAAIQKVEYIYGGGDGSGGSGPSQVAILLAANDTTYWRGYAGYYDTGAFRFKIDKIVDGVQSNLATESSFTEAAAAGDTISFSVEADGSFTLSLKGTPKLTTTDTTYTDGQPGIAVKKSFVSGGIESFSAYNEVVAPTSGSITGSVTVTVTPSSTFFTIVPLTGSASVIFTPSATAFFDRGPPTIIKKVFGPGGDYEDLAAAITAISDRNFVAENEDWWLYGCTTTENSGQTDSPVTFEMTTDEDHQLHIRPLPGYEFWRNNNAYWWEAKKTCIVGTHTSPMQWIVNTDFLDVQGIFISDCYWEVNGAGDSADSTLGGLIRFDRCIYFNPYNYGIQRMNNTTAPLVVMSSCLGLRDGSYIGTGFAHLRGAVDNDSKCIAEQCTFLDSKAMDDVPTHISRAAVYQATVKNCIVKDYMWSAGVPSCDANNHGNVLGHGIFNDLSNLAKTPTSFDGTDNKVICAAHGFADDDMVAMQGTSTAGITAFLIYFVVNSTTDDFQLSLTSGGTPIDMSPDSTDDPVTDQSFYQIVVPTVTGALNGKTWSDIFASTSRQYIDDPRIIDDSVAHGYASTSMTAHSYSNAYATTDILGRTLVGDSGCVNSDGAAIVDNDATLTEIVSDLDEYEFARVSRNFPLSPKISVATTLDGANITMADMLGIAWGRATFTKEGECFIWGGGHSSKLSVWTPYFQNRGDNTEQMRRFDCMNASDGRASDGGPVPYTKTNITITLPDDLDTTTDTISHAAHGLADGDAVAFTPGTTFPTVTGLDIFDKYTPFYVVNSTTDDFQLSLTKGGDPVDFTNAGSGSFSLHATTENYDEPNFGQPMTMHIYGGIQYVPSTSNDGGTQGKIYICGDSPDSRAIGSATPSHMHHIDVENANFILINRDTPNAQYYDYDEGNRTRSRLAYDKDNDLIFKIGIGDASGSTPTLKTIDLTITPTTVGERFSEILNTYDSANVLTEAEGGPAAFDSKRRHLWSMNQKGIGFIDVSGDSPSYEWTDVTLSLSQQLGIETWPNVSASSTQARGRLIYVDTLDLLYFLPSDMLSVWTINPDTYEVTKIIDHSSTRPTNKQSPGFPATGDTYLSAEYNSTLNAILFTEAATDGVWAMKLPGTGIPLLLLSEPLSGGFLNLSGGI